MMNLGYKRPMGMEERYDRWRGWIQMEYHRFLCQTCKNRKYVDGSNEANVSFKNAAHISPEAASSAVRAHEGQHVSNAYHKAATQNGEVVSASVRVQTSVCPECGRSYISGGVTDTQIRYYNESNPYQQDLKQTDGIKLRGANVDEIG